MQSGPKMDFFIYGSMAKLRSSYFGDMMAGATSARFKFGPYRNHMDDATDAGLKINDATIRYSNVGKADSCDELWNGCDEITGQLKKQSQVHGVVDVSFLLSIILFL